MSGPTNKSPNHELDETDLDAVVGGAGRQSHQNHQNHQQSYGHEGGGHQQQSHQQPVHHQQATHQAQAAPSSSGGGGVLGTIGSITNVVQQALPIVSEVAGLFGL